MTGISSQVPKEAAEVALVFPPLVDTNFGKYYPSTAILAGHLSRRAIASRQDDLNEAFAVHLLEPARLEQLGRGIPDGARPLPPDAMAAVSARVLARSRHLLFDAEGRHRFEAYVPGPAHLLSSLAEHYRIDLPVDALATAEFRGSFQARELDAFYRQSGYVESLAPQIHTVGISVPMGPQLGPAVLLARFLRERRPELKIVLGGPTVSLMAPNDIAGLLAHHPIDAIVRYDGELALETLICQRRAGAWAPQTVAGASALVAGAVTHCPPAEGLRLDDLPFGEYDPAILSRLAEPEISVVQARGCYWGECRYCDYVELYEGSPSYRTRTPGKFVDELAFQSARHGVRRFSIITEALPAPFARRISELILERGLSVTWNSFAMVDKHFTLEVFAAMRRAGCEYLVIGMETMTDRVLRLVKKASTQQANIRFMNDARAAGVDLKINLIPDLPSTTYAEAEESLRLFEANRSCFSYASVFPFEATRSSAVGRAPADFGLVPLRLGPSDGQAQYAANHLPVQDAGMTDDERREIHQRFRALAERLNARETPDTRACLTETELHPDVWLRLADEYLDFASLLDDGIQCYHWGTRQRLRLDRVWEVVFERLRAEAPIRAADLVQRFSPTEMGEHVLHQLVRHRLLRSCGPLGPLPLGK